MLVCSILASSAAPSHWPTTHRRISNGVRPADDSPREIYRFRRRTEPWALSALAFLGATDLYDAVRAARAADHPEPLLRGEDVLALGIEPGPEVGRLLELVAEERAVGTIATRDEALDLVRADLGARP